MQCSKPYFLFDHLIGEDVELRRDRYPESVGGLTIDHQVEFGRLLDRQVAGLCTLENLVDKRRGATEEIEEVLAIAHQPTSLHVIALWKHGRQTVHKCKRGNALALLQEYCVRSHHDRLHAVRDECGECIFRFPRVARFHRYERKAGFFGGLEGSFPDRWKRRTGRISEQRDARWVDHNRRQQLHLFWSRVIGRTS